MNTIPEMSQQKFGENSSDSIDSGEDEQILNQVSHWSIKHAYLGQTCIFVKIPYTILQITKLFPKQSVNSSNRSQWFV